MTRRISLALLPSLLLLTGCQSAGNVFPWFASNEPMYSAEQLASVNNPVPAASQSPGNIMPASAQQTVMGQDGQPAAAARIEQLIQSGRTAIEQSGDSDPVKLAEARSLFEEAISLAPSNGSAHHGVAIVADLQQDWVSAERHYKQALSQKPQDANLLNDLGYSYVLQNRFHEAQQYLNQAIQISPQLERAHINMALLSLKSGDRNAAATQLANAFPPAQAQNLIAQLEADIQQQNQFTAPQGQPQQIMTAQSAAPQWPGNIAAVSQHRPLMPQQQQQQQNPPATQGPPVHVYPPGIELKPEPEATNPLAQQLQQPAASANNQYAQQPYYASQPRNGQPWVQGNAGYGANGPIAQPPAQGNQQPYPMLPNARQLPPQPGTLQQYPPAQRYPQTQQYAQPQQHNSPAPVGVPAGGVLATPQPQQQLPSQQHSAAQVAPIMGLNAGPGNLFPIPVQHGTTAPRLQPNHPSSAIQGQNNPPQAANSQSYGLMPNTVQQQHPQQQLHPTQSAGYGQAQFNQLQTQQAQYPYGNQYPQSAPGQSTNQAPRTVQGISSQTLPTPLQTASLPTPAVAAPYVSPNNLSGSTQQPSASPMSAYERQLQGIDRQYNQALQQMNGRAVPTPSQMPMGVQ